MTIDLYPFDRFNRCKVHCCRMCHEFFIEVFRGNKKKKEGVGFDTSTREAENTGVITLYRGVSQKLTSVRGCDAVLSEMSLS